MVNWCECRVARCVSPSAAARRAISTAHQHHHHPHLINARRPPRAYITSQCRGGGSAKMIMRDVPSARHLRQKISSRAQWHRYLHLFTSSSPAYTQTHTQTGEKYLPEILEIYRCNNNFFLWNGSDNTILFNIFKKISRFLVACARYQHPESTEVSYRPTAALIYHCTSGDSGISRPK